MKIAIVEDHLMMREMLRKVCGDCFPSAEVVDAENGPVAVERIVTEKPELILLDLVLPEFDGFEVLRRIRQRRTYRPRVLMLSGFLDAYNVYRVSRAEISGFVDKRMSQLHDVRTAIVAASEGRSYYSPTYHEACLKQRQDPQAFFKLLTDQESRVLLLIGELIPDAEIAARLGISVRTVETHRHVIKQKLGVRSKPDLYHYARINGLMPMAHL